jgi:hypothetical protein
MAPAIDRGQELAVRTVGDVVDRRSRREAGDHRPGQGAVEERIARRVRLGCSRDRRDPEEGRPLSGGFRSALDEEDGRAARDQHQGLEQPGIAEMADHPFAKERLVVPEPLLWPSISHATITPSSSPGISFLIRVVLARRVFTTRFSLERSRVRLEIVRKVFS